MAISSTVTNYTLDGTLAPLEIGAMVGTFLFGILTLQTFNYYRQSPRDSRLLKLTNILADKYTPQAARAQPHDLFLTCSASFVLLRSCSDKHKIYWITVTTHDRPSYAIVAEPPQSLYITLVSSGGIHLLFQLFFGNRIRVLSERLHIFLLPLRQVLLYNPILWLKGKYAPNVEI
ncbi:hypothetical protein FB451DRAFT_1189243 [Mycena latifolia]|nr:hypothetical protein FB451DRAFT_1189243 [Mycena latifolia]